MFGRRLERLERQESHLNDKQQRSKREDQISREAEEKYHRLLGDDYSEPNEEQLPELSDEEAQEIYDKLFD